MSSTLMQQLREINCRNGVHGKTNTSNIKQTTPKRRQYTDSASFITNTSDDLSENSFRGRCFLKSDSKEKKKSSFVREQSIESSEEENTEDLLVAFEAPISKKGISKSPKSRPSSNSVSSKLKRRSSPVDKHQSPVTSTVHTNLKSISTSSTIRASSAFDNMLLLRDDGEDGFMELSAVSFIDDESIKDETKTDFCADEPSQTKSIFSTSNVLLAVDEMDEETESRSKRISNKTEQRWKKRDTNEDRPSTVSEVKEYTVTESVPVPSQIQTTVQNTAPSPYESDIESISDEEPNSTSLSASHSVRTRSTSHTPEPVDPDQYSDDFESEPEMLPNEPLDNCQINRRSNTVEHKRGQQNDANIRTTEKGRLPNVTSNTCTPHKNSTRGTDAKLLNSVEVQTMWTGDWIPAWNGPISSGYPTCVPPSTYQLQDAHYSLKPKPIIKTVVDDRALQTLMEHNPCVVALDNMLQQQVKITRDFLSTQRQLHDAISTALNRCLTTDYITWENTAKLLKSSDSP